MVASRSGGHIHCAIVGPTLRARRFEIRERGSVSGIRFWPDSGGAVVGADVRTLRDRRIPSDLLRSDDIGTFDALLIAGGVPAMTLDEQLRRAVEAIIASRGGLSLTELSAGTGLSIRRLQRRFSDWVGLTPKEFARVRRVRSVIAAILGGRQAWADVAAEYGYSDQSHLARDLAEITGFTPSSVEDHLAAIEHRNVIP